MVEVLGVIHSLQERLRLSLDSGELDSGELDRPRTAFIANLILENEWGHGAR